ncbi:MAG: protein translocase subunit SecD [Clostridia bacterium]|nr:protein translocase subunit SecD [Clostridia bacterium]
MGKSIAKLLIVIVLIAAIVYGAFFDITIGKWKKPGVFTDVESGDPYKVGAVIKGLDLTGGSVITFEADADNVTSEQMSTVITIMRTRLDSLGYNEATVRSQGDTKIVIEMPSITDPDEAVRVLGQTAQLRFVDADGNEVLNGTDVKSATRQFGQTTELGAAENYVELQLNDSGVDKFTEATKKAAAAGEGKNFIAIVLDETVVSQPFVDPKLAGTGINSGSAIITGGFTAEGAQELASLISAGQLPFNLNLVSSSSVGATLGENALESSLVASAIGIAIVLLFMLILYKVCGLAADIALFGYIGVLMLVLGLLRVNLTLPGIAGVILSIGMAVDANVVIFERIKEEIRSGKTIRASINSGFKRAFAAIIDSNVTTMITAVVLYVIGSGTIKGFAITLGLGIVISMFTAIFVTKFILVQLSNIFGKKAGFYIYGANKKKEEE